MKIRYLLLFIFLEGFRLFAQSPAQTLQKGQEGAMPIPNAALRSAATGQSTRAVVVGISDYQSPQIPDLQFADKDAAAFADWLLSPAGGNVPPDNVQLLPNEKATQARLIAALDWLIETSKPGDQAVIYFSGHGDVEVKTDFQLGFLLPWDSPPLNYMAGAYPLFYLQAVISTLSNKNVRVMVIADACHAGKLAGSDIGGAAITGSNLARQFAKEIKILSCAPNEFSMEGKQWGGGRGAFSFHLVNGLYGFADQNLDSVVNLLEIGRYLQDRVSPEVAPLSQTPMTVGLPTEKIAFIDVPSFEKLKVETSGRPPELKPIENRGLEDEVLARAEPAARTTYLAFKKALAERRFFEPHDSCADVLYAHLVLEKSLEPLHNTARRNYAVALQDESQQTLNALLESDPYEVTKWEDNVGQYAEYPVYLQRAMELLGTGHYAYNALLVKKLYFEAYSLQFASNGTTPARKDSIRTEAKRLLQQAIALEPEAAYLYIGIANLYLAGTVFSYQTDSVVRYCRLASRYAPQWLLPYFVLSLEYGIAQSDLVASDSFLMQAYRIKPESYLVLERLSWLRQWQRRLDEAIAITEKSMALRPDLFNGAGTMAMNYFLKRDYIKAEEWSNKSLAISGNSPNWCTGLLHIICLATRHPVRKCARFGALEGFNDFFRIQFVHDPDSIIAYAQSVPDSTLDVIALAQKYALLGKARFEKGDLEQARHALLYSLTLDPTTNAWFALDYAYLGRIEAAQGRIAAAEAYFQKAIQSPFITFFSDTYAREETWFLYGRFLLEQNRYAEARQWFQKTVDWAYGNGYYGYYGLALLAAKKGRPTEALDWLEKALDRWYPRPEPILEEPLFSAIKNTKRFKALMAKHFPPGWESR